MNRIIICWVMKIYIWAFHFSQLQLSESNNNTAYKKNSKGNAAWQNSIGMHQLQSAIWLRKKGKGMFPTSVEHCLSVYRATQHIIICRKCTECLLHAEILVYVWPSAYHKRRIANCADCASVYVQRSAEKYTLRSFISLYCTNIQSHFENFVKYIVRMYSFAM